MKVQDVIDIKGRGTVVVVEFIQGDKIVKVGDILTDGKGDWRITGVELSSPIHSRDDVGLILNRIDGIGPPDKGAELALKPVPLLDQELGRVTLRQFLDAFAKDQADRVELAGALQKLGHAVNHLELVLDKEHDVRHAGLKQMREAFNCISPKWFHR